jgi:hypothetical protein
MLVSAKLCDFSDLAAGFARNLLGVCLGFAWDLPEKAAKLACRCPPDYFA